MIRRTGNTTSATTNVLNGTQFQTITRPTRIRVRAVGENTTSVSAEEHGKAPGAVSNFTYNADLLAQLVLEDSTLSKSTLRQFGDNVSAAQADQSTRGLDDDCIVFDGMVQQGNLILTFPGASSTNKVIWDVTAY